MPFKDIYKYSKAVKVGKFPSYTIKKMLIQHKQSLSLASTHHCGRMVLVGGPQIPIYAFPHFSAAIVYHSINIT